MSTRPSRTVPAAPSKKAAAASLKARGKAPADASGAVSPAAADASKPKAEKRKPTSKQTRPDPLPGLVSEVFVCGEVELWARAQGLGVLIGLDEAGRGPLAGPVVVAACALPDPCPLVGIDDSKKLTEAEREALFEPILACALGVGLVVVEHEVIDDMNILRASLHGMALAWEQLVLAQPHLRASIVLVDGRDRAPLPAEIDQRPIIKGDARSLNIAAASILAKVARDRIMHVYHAEFPDYGFDRHKGYPTVAHRAAVERHGPSPIHRKSFNMPFGPNAAPPAQADGMDLFAPLGAGTAEP